MGREMRSAIAVAQNASSFQKGKVKVAEDEPGRAVGTSRGL